MADTSTRISGPVSVKADSAERVAYDLMEKIAGFEDSPERAKRDYWLTLFHQCRKATYSTSLEAILKKQS
jgi:hypothetical protein